MSISGPNLALFLSVFLASAVEAVEAVTIVLAAGTARNWKSAFRGVGAGIALLAFIIAVAGPAISHLPISSMRLGVGGLLLVFGLQWLRKAILRASGFKALHDEARIFQEEMAAAQKATKKIKFGVSDWYAFTLAFKGVLLEGLEVVFIVLTFGTIQKEVGLASFAALLAVVMATAAGFALAKPLTRVPENSMKFVVGVMLTSFGIFWGGEGSGVMWPGKDLSLIALIAFTSITAISLIALLKKKHQISQESLPDVGLQLSEKDEVQILTEVKTGFIHGVVEFGKFWYDFIIGDDWRVAAGIVFTFVATHYIHVHLQQSWTIIPICTALLLMMSVRTATTKS
ncbi:MAG: hypothetical protein WCO85_00595 [Actinomycetes bacterium]